MLASERKPLTAHTAGGVLVNKDITEANVRQLVATLDDPTPPSPSSTSPVKALLHTIAHLPHDERGAIVVDLLYATLQFSLAQDYTTTQTATLLAMVKCLHATCFPHGHDATLSLDAALVACQGILVDHAVHRPPFSHGVFSLAETRSIFAWLQQSFFRVYKLHVYAFSFHVTKDISLAVEIPGLETPTSVTATTRLLREAMPYEEHEAEVAAAKEAAELAAKEEAERRAAEAEERRQKELEEAYLSTLPRDVQEKVILALNKELKAMRKEVEGEFEHRHAQLEARLKDVKV